MCGALLLSKPLDVDQALKEGTRRLATPGLAAQGGPAMSPDRAVRPLKTLLIDLVCRSPLEGAPSSWDLGTYKH